MTIITRDTKIREYQEFFGGHPNVERIILHGTYRATPGEFDTGIRQEAVPCPGTATLSTSSVSIRVWDFDTHTDEQREAYRRHLIACGTTLGDFARNERERALYGDERGKEREVFASEYSLGMDRRK